MNTYSIYPKQYNNSEYKLKNNTCFVIMPFSEELNNTYMVVDTAAQEKGIKCTRADNISTSSEPILSKICTEISQSYFIIVDITDLNPNVFYELGIAHVLRDANKVLIIKEEKTTCPSDIRHLHYYPYKKSDLASLKKTVECFFTENDILQDLYSILLFRDLITDDNILAREVVSNLSSAVGELIETLILVLNSKTDGLNESGICELLKRLTSLQNSHFKDGKSLAFYANLTLFVVTKVYQKFNIAPYITEVFNQEYPNLTTDWIADLCLVLVNSKNYFENAINWIMDYLKNVSPAEFDLAKYQIEIGLIQSENSQIDLILQDNLKNSNKTIAEHCAKIIKERRTLLAIPILQELVAKEENPYVVRSCIDALVHIAPLNILLDTKRTLSYREEYINQNSFIKKHICDLNKRIEELQNRSDN